MLYRGLVGPEPPTHPEIAAFRKGFNLPCSGGFNFSEVSVLPCSSFKGDSCTCLRFLSYSKVAPQHFGVSFIHLELPVPMTFLTVQLSFNQTLVSSLYVLGSI